MQVTVNIPDDLVALVTARGMALDSYVQRLVVADATHAKTSALHRLGPGPYTAEEAGQWIRENRAANRLDGLTIKELVNEGRKY